MILRTLPCLLAVAISTSSLLSAPAGQVIELSTTTATDNRLLAQQKLLTDAVAAVFVALRTSFELALTNQLQAAAVLAAYTNTLDAAQAAQVAQAIDQWALGVTTTMEGFLASLAEENAALRNEIRDDVAATVDAQVDDAVSRLATGTVLEDVLTDSRAELLHNTTHAIHSRGDHVALVVSPLDAAAVAVGDMPRYTATAVIYADPDRGVQTLTVDLPTGTTAWSAQRQWTLAAGTYTRVSVQQLTSSLYWVEVKTL